MSQDMEKGLIGIKLSQLPQNGSTKPPLHEAVKNSDLKTIYELAQTEDINIKDNDGNTALHTAIKRGNIYIIQVLLISPFNLDINATNKEGQTPLHLALNISNKSNQSSKQIISVLSSQEEIDLESAKYNGKSCRDILKEEWIVMYMFYMLYQEKTKKFIDLAKTNRSLLEENDGYRTFLQYACYKGLTDIVKALLHLNVNPIGESHVLPLTLDEEMAESSIIVHLLDQYVNPIRKSQGPPLKIAATYTCPLEILQMLLMHPLIRGGTNNNGNTALHIAVKLKVDEFSLTEDDKISIIERLCDSIMTIKDKKNEEGQTPLDLAIAEGNEDILIRKFQFWDLKNNLNLKTILNRNRSFREKFEQKHPKLALYYYLNLLETEKFISLAEKIDREVLEEEIYDSTLLGYACCGGQTKIVKTLLDKGVDPNGKFCKDKFTSPLSFAIRSGFYEILQMLLENSSLNKIPPNSLSWLGHIKRRYYSIKQFGTADIDGMKCLKLLWPRIDRNRFYINDLVHENGGSILNVFQYSTDADDSFILELLKLDPFIGGVNVYEENTFIYLKPLLLEKYLDECVFMDNSKSIKEIEFNYKSFAPPENYSSTESLNSSTESQINENQSNVSPETVLFLKMGGLPEFRQLLKHPVIASLLNLKWLVMRKFFYINVIFYFIFCILLTIYLSSKYVSWSSINSSQNSNGTQSSNFNATTSTPNITESFKSDPVYVIILHGATILFWVIFSLREVIQLSFLPLWYIKSLENWIEMSIVIMGGFVLFQTSSIDYRLLALVTLLSWGEAVLLIGKHPKLSIYLRMFKTVTWNFLAFLLFYGILILAFALGFCFLFSRESTQNKDNPFENPLVAFFKIFIMMTGEFNSSEFQFEEFPLLSRIIFIIFVFLIAIVLSSLLNGLAVGDIQTIRSDAELLEIMYRIEMFQYYESMPVLNMLSNMFNWLTKVEWLNQWTFEKCETLKSWFSMALFPDVIENYKSYVNLECYNAVFFEPGNSRDYVGMKSSRFERFFMWKIHSDIVNTAKRLEEKKIKNKIKITMEDVFNSKFQTIEKMLMENLHAVQKISKRFDDVERISKSNEKKN